MSAPGELCADPVNALGIKLPIYPIKGYSVTLPVTDDTSAPQSTIMDETHKVAITRLGDRIRVAGPPRSLAIAAVRSQCHRNGPLRGRRSLS